jgi:nucleoside-diphosphate-sugar epimerase
VKVVVTGASGNVGTALLRSLAEEPRIRSVVGIARRPVEQGPGTTTWVQADLARDDVTDVLRGADVVVHLAWLFHPTRHPQVTWDNNVIGSQRLLDAVDRAEVPALVVASSVGAYAPRRDLSPVTEEWPTTGAPTAAYSREKAYVERLLDVFEARHGDVRLVRMRPGFIFQESSAVQQRRLFLGPLVPHALLRRGRLPVVPLPRGLQIQALHSSDAAAAYAAAVLQPVHGAFNLAADPSLDGPALARLLRSRPVEVPVPAVRAALQAAFTAHAVPASPGLFDLAMSVPMMSTERARRELGWQPAYDAEATVDAFLDGIAHARGGATPPLAPETSGPLRSHEVSTGVGERP